jgi:predicted transcriptional regulator
LAESRYKKLTINVSPEVHEELQRLADARGITITELIKRAVALEKFVWEHREGELLLKEGDRVREIVHHL